MRLAAWVLALAALAPTAGAAEARLGATFAPVPLLLPGEARVVEGNLTYSFDAPAANLTNLTIVPVAAPEWLAAQVEPGRAEVRASGAEGRSVVPLRLTLAVRPGTPALEQHTLQLRLEASANPPLEPAAATVGVAVRVGFQGLLRVEGPDGPVAARAGEPVRVALRVVNEGNGPTRVAFQAPRGPDGLAALVPGPVLVETRGSLRDRGLNVSLLPAQAGVHAVVLAYQSTHAFDPALLGPGGEVRFTVDAAGAALLPGPGPGDGALAGGLAAALAAGAAGLRRRAARRGPR